MSSEYGAYTTVKPWLEPFWQAGQLERASGVEARGLFGVDARGLFGVEARGLFGVEARGCTARAASSTFTMGSTV